MMENQIVKAALDGAKITIESDCWPFRRKAQGIHISITKQTWNGVRTMSREVKFGELGGLEALEELVNTEVRGMAEIIETDRFFTGK